MNTFYIQCSHLVRQTYQDDRIYYNRKRTSGSMSVNNFQTGLPSNLAHRSQRALMIAATALIFEVKLIKFS